MTWENQATFGNPVKKFKVLIEKERTFYACEEWQYESGDGTKPFSGHAEMGEAAWANQGHQAMHFDTSSKSKI